VRGTVQKKNELHFIIERPDGETQLIPISWTNQGVVEPAARGARFTPRQLIALRRWLDNHLQSNSLDKSEDVLSPKEKSNPLGGKDDELEQPISSRSMDSLASPPARAKAASTGSDGGYGSPTLESSADLEHPSPHAGRGR
jgi:hypothetical protein